MSAPYHAFGLNCYRLRESKGKSREEVAKFLGLTTEEYSFLFETGHTIPQKHLILEWAQLLDEDPTRAFRWISYGPKNEENDIPAKGLERFLDEYTTIKDKIPERYKKVTGREMTKDQKFLVDSLKRDILKLPPLPVLPMSAILYLNALSLPEYSHCKYLHEIKDYVLEGESFAGFASRGDPYLAVSIFHSYNAFASTPCEKMEDCFNMMTIEEFKEYLFIAINEEKLYTTDEEIPLLTESNDFNSLAVLMARELSKYLPESINVEHVKQVCLLQGLGKYVLFHLLHPSLVDRTGDLDETWNKLSGISEMDENLFSCIMVQLHPVISSMIASTFNLDQEVLDTLLDRHKQPSSEVTPLCAVVKIINRYVDEDFQALSKIEIEEILNIFPQISIKPEHLFNVTQKLQAMKEKFYERSSKLVEDFVESSHPYLSDRVKNKYQEKSLGLLETYKPVERHEFRFAPNYQRTLLNVAYPKLLDFTNEMFLPSRKENLGDLFKRSERLLLRIAYLKFMKDFEVVSKKADQPIEEIKKKIFNK